MNLSKILARPRSRFLLLAVLVVLPYLNGLDGAFVFDDDKQIVHNPSVRSLVPVTKFFSSKRPIVEITLALNHAVSGLETWSYHLVNIAIHVLTALLIMAWLTRLLPAIRGLDLKPETSATLAFVIALLWAVHPLQTETVTYVIQRAESLASFFYVAALFFWLRSRDGEERSPGRLVLTGLCAWFGMMTKSIVITLPLALLLQDHFVHAKGRRSLTRANVLAFLFVLSAGLHPVLTGLLKGVTRGVHGGQAAVGFTVKGISAWDYLLSQAESVAGYLLLLVAPFRLCLDHGRRPPESLSEVILPGLFVLGLLGLGLYGLLRRRPLALGLLFFFLVLAPTSSFIPIRDIFVEHRVYLAMLGPLAIFVVLGARLVSSPRSSLALVALLYVVLSTLTVVRNTDYATELGMWQDIVAKCPENPRGHYTLGVFEARQRDHASAIRHAERALELDPDYDLAWVLIASSEIGRNRPVEAEAAARRALEIDDDLQIAYTNLGDALMNQNRVEEAIEAHRAAIKAKKKFPSPHVDLAEALLRHGDIDEAWTSLETAFERGASEDPRAWQLKAVILRRRGDFAGAVAAYREGLALRPDSHDLHLNLAIALQAMGRYDEAALEAEIAGRLDPGSWRAHLALATLLGLAGDFASSVRNFEMAEALHVESGLAGSFPAAQSLRWARRLQQAALDLEKADGRPPESATPEDLSYFAEVALLRDRRVEGLAWLAEALSREPKLARDLERALRFKGARAALALAREETDARHLRQALTWLEADLELRRDQLDAEGFEAQAARLALLTWLGHVELQDLWDERSPLGERERRARLRAAIEALLDSGD